MGEKNVRIDISKWQHVFKLDPAKEISDDALEKVCESGTDAIIVGGTDDVTLDGVLDLLYRVRRYMLPCVLEVSTMEAITPGFDYYFIPSVFNSRDKKWFLDIQHQAIKEYHSLINWEELVVEGYCIVNESSKAFQKANCRPVDGEDVVAYALMAEKYFQLPIFYIEYSGRYGDVEIVQQAKESLDKTLLFYGGGITSAKQAKEMKQHADVIVVGNIIYDDLEAALETVKAVK